MDGRVFTLVFGLMLSLVATPHLSDLSLQISAHTRASCVTLRLPAKHTAVVPYGFVLWAVEDLGTATPTYMKIRRHFKPQQSAATVFGTTNSSARTSGKNREGGADQNGIARSRWAGTHLTATLSLHIHVCVCTAVWKAWNTFDLPSVSPPLELHLTFPLDAGRCTQPFPSALSA